MSYLKEIADKYLPPARNNYQLHKVDYDTSDIITIIEKDHPLFVDQTKAFSSKVPGKNKLEYLQNLYRFVKDNIQYRQDDPGTQLVKSPAQVWHDKVCDCKSYALFFGTTLENAGIPYYYRFVSFSDNPRPTHVYIIVPHAGKYITMDAVMPGYNQEKPFKYKKDMQIRGLYTVSGIAENKKLLDLGNKDLADMSEAELELLIARDRLNTAKQITEGVRGIGSLTASRYQDDIDMIDDALEVVQDPNADHDAELQKIAYHSVNGIYTYAKSKGSLENWNKNRPLRKKQRKMSSVSGVTDAEWEQIGTTKTGKFLKKVASKVKKAATTVAKKAATVVKKVAVTAAKVVTAPASLVIKGILELTLPQSAPFFLYLFIDPKNLATMPANVKKKRDAEKKIFDFIVKGIGMKESHVMGILRNGILKHYKKEPEKVIADLMANKAISGIYGSDPAIVNVTKTIIQQLGGKITVLPSDAPSNTDFSDSPYKKVNTVKASQNPVLEKYKSEFVAAGPFFMYLFINDPNLFAKLPPPVRSKRKKQEQIANFIANSTKIPKAQIMILFREGIRNQYGKEPEKYLSEQLNMAISGIGIGFVVSAAAVTAVINIIKKIAGLLKKDVGIDVSDKFGASTDDWKGVSASEAKTLTKAVENQEPAGALLVTSDQKNQNNGGTSVWNSLSK